MNRAWIDVKISANLDAGELISRLDDPSVQGSWQDAGVLHLYWAEDQWSQDCLIRLSATLRELNESGLLPPLDVDQVPDQDWNRLWAQSVKPLRVGPRLMIRPSWESVVLEPGEIEIILDPKQAFGTGHHATTRILLEWLQEDIRGGETVLDVGTGSGILAMAALRLGAARAVGIDHDSVAIECAQEYARMNRFGGELLLRCGELEGGQSFDLVLANLDRHTLLQLTDRLTSCAKRRLLVSGLLVDQCEEIAEACSAAGFYPGRKRERDGWLAMEFLPAQSCEGL